MSAVDDERVGSSGVAPAGPHGAGAASSEVSDSNFHVADEVVDLSALARLDGVTLAEQVGIYEQLHHGVQAALSRIENG